MGWFKGKGILAVLVIVPIAVGLGLGVGCTNKQEKTIAAVANPEYVQPIGHIQGVIVDACTQEAIEDVEVSISVKGKKKTYTTGNSGQFSFWELPVNVGETDCTDCNCYIVVASFEKYNDKEENEDTPYPLTVEGRVCLVYEYINNNEGSVQALTVTGSGAATVVDGLTGEVRIEASRPVATVRGDAFWGKDLSPAEGIALNLYWDPDPEDEYNIVLLEAQAVVDSDGEYVFNAVHECREYTIEPAKPCFEYATASGYEEDDIITALATQLSPEGDLVDTWVECIQLDPIPCLDEEAPCVFLSDPKYNEDITDLTPSIVLTWSELMDETIPVDEVVEIVWEGFKQETGEPPAVTYDYTWSTASMQIPGFPEADTPPTVSVLTLTPVEDLLPGSIYVVDLAADLLDLDLELMDLAGNGYWQGANACQAAVRAPDDEELQFTTRYGGSCPTAADLAQVTGISDALQDPYGAPPLEVRNTMYYDPVGGDTDSEYMTDQAVVSWSRPATGQVRGWRIYARYNANDPWVRIGHEEDTTSALGPYAAQWPDEDDTGKDLGYIDGLLGDMEVEQLPNTNWEDGLELDIGVAAVTRDKRECPIVSITVGDTECPLMVRNHEFDIDDTMYDQLATQWYDATSEETVALGDMIYPSGTLTANLYTCEFGQVPFILEFTEDINMNTITDIEIMASPTPSLSDLTFCEGFYTDPNDTDDGDIIARYPGDEDNEVILVIDNGYKMDSGDIFRSLLVADESGNICTPLDSNDWVHMIDTIPVMFKSIAVNPTTDTLTLTLTESVPEGDDQDNIELITYCWDDNGCTAGGTANPAGVPSVDSAAEPNTVAGDGVCDDGSPCNGYTVTTTGDESVITVYLNDVSFIQPNNQIALNNMEDNAWTDSTRAANEGTDDGTDAYWYGNPDEPGAYDPDGGTGLGTNTSFTDDDIYVGGVADPNRAFGIAPRLHPTDQPTHAAAGIAQDVDTTINSINFTEPLDDPADNPAAWVTYDPNRPANWTITIRDCGVDASCGDPGETNVNCPVTAVANAGNAYTYNVTCHTPANAGHTYAFDEGGTTITVTNVRDERHEVISGHNSLTYDANDSQWERN